MLRKNENLKDLDSVVIQTQNDVRNLECQIRNMLRALDVVSNISQASVLDLSTIDSKDGETERMRMQRNSSDGSRKGKTLPEYKPGFLRRDVGDESGNLEELSDLDILDLCINEKTDRYIPVQESAYFAPMLDRCVFGMTLLNVANIKLKKPTISLSLVNASDCTDNISRSMPPLRCFLHDVQVTLKEANPEGINLLKTDECLACYDSFIHCMELNDEVMPGCEVTLSATFAYPTRLLENCKLALLMSVYLDGEELWAREIPITSNNFTAINDDDFLRRNHLSIITALGKYQEIFKIERLLSRDETAPYKSFMRFLLPLGYEKIQSTTPLSDTTIEVYTVHQPSLLWGSCFRIEKCSKKPSMIRCLVTARYLHLYWETKEQMWFLSSQFHTWLQKESHKERKLGLTGIAVLPIRSNSSISTCNKILAEIDLIEKFQQVKSTLRKGCESEHPLGRKQIDTSNIDCTWMYEYSSCVKRTDMVFVSQMK